MRTWNYYGWQILLLVALAIIPRGASGQLVNIAPNTGAKYGITAWYGSGQQTGIEDGLARDKVVGGYGVNIKYGPEKLFWIEIDSSKKKAVCIGCPPNTIDSIVVRDTTWLMRVSFGLGYLGYSGLEYPAKELEAEFDAGGAYAGVYASVPLPFGEKDPWISLLVGYTSAVLTPDAIVTTYKGPELAGQTNTPITFKIPTTITHEVNLGITIKRRLFLEYNHQWFNAKNVMYSPVNADNALRAELQKTLPSSLDLSFWSFKAGLSFDF